MRSDRPSTPALIISVAIVVASLAALVILPVVMSARVDRLRTTLTSHADPARSRLNEINFRLSEQIAALTRAISTGDERYIGRYRGAVRPQVQALEALERHRGYLGPDFDKRLDELKWRLELWHRSVERSMQLDGLVFDANYPEVMKTVRKLDQSITRFQAERRREVERLAGMQVWLTVALVLAAAAAAAIVLWMMVRLRALAEALERESAARQSALERQQELVSNREQILSVVSHDLRNPLTTISLTTQLIPESSDEERAEHVETVLTNTRRMERLIQDLLDVTKIEQGGLSVRSETVDAAQVANEIIGSHQSIANSRDIRLESEIDPSLPQIRGDADRLAQALGNLIGNAFKFTPAGGVVRLAVERRDGTVRFTVSDTGPGIDPEEMPHLFEPFWQAEDTAHMGAGLGLKITRAIVEAHEGTMEVENNSDGGATFAFEIPALREE